LLLVFTLLGRSKSEQYFGFLPFFSYIDFILGYVPLILGDLISQVIITTYLLYNLLNLTLVSILNKITNRTLFNLKTHYFNNKKLTNSLTQPKNINNISDLFKNNTFINTSTPYTNDKHSILLQFSKQLNTLNSNIFLLNIIGSKLTTNHNYNFYSNLNLVTLKTKNKNTFSKCSSITLDEAFYKNTPILTNSKVINLKSTLLDINKIYKIINNSSFLHFNIENSINISKQQRWLSKNSLLSESITQNSFLITQSKELIGSGILDKNFSSKNLWLPTKLSKLSSLESTIYLNNLLSTFYTNNTLLNFTKQNTLNNSNTLNLNFFENSRFWIFKKYYFSINQNNNLVTENIKHSTFNSPLQNKHTLNNNFYYNLYTVNLLNLLKNNFTPSLN
jgi:hypothetical protein